MPSPTLVGFLEALNVGLAAGIVLLVAAMIATRAARRWRDARERSFAARWEPILYERMEDPGLRLPPLSRRDRVPFLALWLKMLGYVSGEAYDELVRAGRQAGMEALALQLLESGLTWRRLLALQAAGVLRLRASTARLAAEAGGNDARISLTAVGALMKIDLDAGLATLFRLLPSSDWPPAVVASLLKPAGGRAAQDIGRALADASPPQAIRLARVIESLEDPTLAPALRARLIATHNRPEKAALIHALARVGSAEDRRAALALLADRHWLVRMQAAFALGQLGFEDDAQALLPLLRDPQWWVRYRAAQALHALLQGSPERFAGILEAEGDRYARDALLRVAQEARGAE